MLFAYQIQYKLQKLKANSKDPGKTTWMCRLTSVSMMIASTKCTFSYGATQMSNITIEALARVHVNPVTLKKNSKF